jgi:hypothetical protein
VAKRPQGWEETELSMQQRTWVLTHQGTCEAILGIAIAMLRNGRCHRTWHFRRGLRALETWQIAQVQTRFFILMVRWSLGEYVSLLFFLATSIREEDYSLTIVNPTSGTNIRPLAFVQRFR